ncbi:hypothetical protein [Sphingobacterium sp. UBA5996]|uniref:hypothetical protein n=1 Tax=Sphingobacterium sp. UBA5996 TaxID=1947505 RepID=UPI0025D9A47B|nr:hypothetical protein [Sphingobacterium sp. UBA5996]
MEQFKFNNELSNKIALVTGGKLEGQLQKDYYRPEQQLSLPRETLLKKKIVICITLRLI